LTKPAEKFERPIDEKRGHMILLDSDHLTLLRYPGSARCAALASRMQAAAEQVIGTTIVNVEEQMRGWLALIARHRRVREQVSSYEELIALLGFVNRWTVVPLDDRAADKFEELRRTGVRIGAMDLKIASIALVHHALLLSANLQHFHRVPGQKVENWIVEA